jgi:phosphoribosyl-ATP pyrophosphohydrolase
LIGVMTYAFARIGAIVAMRVDDYYPNGKRWWVRLHEKGGKRHEMPAHHKLEAFIDEYLAAAGIRDDAKGPLFRSVRGRTGELTAEPMHRVDAYRMIRRRTAEAGFNRNSAATSFARPASPPISKPGAPWKMPKPWQRTKARAPRSSTTAPATKLRSMRSSGSRFEAGYDFTWDYHMAKTTKKNAAPSPAALKKRTNEGAHKTPKGKTASVVPRRRKIASGQDLPDGSLQNQTAAANSDVLNRLWSIIDSRKEADPATSHSARLLARGTPQVVQKLGEELIECLIEAMAGNRVGLIAESADVLYHLLVTWVNAGVRPDEVWAELSRRENISHQTEEVEVPRNALLGGIEIGTTKIP